VVEGRHAEKTDELGSIERHFVRKFQLPRLASPETVTSNLTADGQLTVTAEAPRMKSDSPARTIPIKVVAGATSANGSGTHSPHPQTTANNGAH